MKFSNNTIMPTNKDVMEVARSYLGAKWKHQGRSKLYGMDCIGLIVNVAHDLKLFNFDVNDYGRIPDGEKLKAGCDKILIPVKKLEFGAIVLMKFTLHPQHLAIIGDQGSPFSAIHSYTEARKCVEHSIDKKFEDRIISIYRYPRVNYEC